MNAFAVDLLRTVESAHSALDEGFSISVRIPDDDSIPLDADGERDYGNADWPTDEAIAAEVERQIGRPVAVKFFDKGDDLCEGVYHVTAAPAGYRIYGTSSPGWLIRCRPDPCEEIAEDEAERVTR